MKLLLNETGERQLRFKGEEGFKCVDLTEHARSIAEAIDKRILEGVVESAK